MMAITLAKSSRHWVTRHEMLETLQKRSGPNVPAILGHWIRADHGECGLVYEGWVDSWMQQLALSISSIPLSRTVDSRLSCLPQNFSLVRECEEWRGPLTRLLRSRLWSWTCEKWLCLGALLVARCESDHTRWFPQVPAISISLCYPTLSHLF